MRYYRAEPHNGAKRVSVHEARGVSAVKRDAKTASVKVIFGESHRGGTVADVSEFYVYARRKQFFIGSGKSFDLCVGRKMGKPLVKSFICLCQMREHSANVKRGVTVYFGYLLYRFIYLGFVSRTKSYSVHSRVELDLTSYPHSCYLCLLGKLVCVSGVNERGDDIMLCQKRCLRGQGVSENKYLGVSPVFKADLSYIYRFLY